MGRSLLVYPLNKNVNINLSLIRAVFNKEVIDMFYPYALLVLYDPYCDITRYIIAALNSQNLDEYKFIHDSNNVKYFYFRFDRNRHKITCSSHVRINIHSSILGSTDEIPFRKREIVIKDVPFFLTKHNTFIYLNQEKELLPVNLLWI